MWPSLPPGTLSPSSRRHWNGESKKKEGNAVWGSRDSFVDVVKGGTRVHNEHEGLVMELTQTDLVKLEELQHSLMLKVKDVNHMENLYFLCQ
ncbi:hypothetical protein L1987_15350 [Smallanthus sonchifolius]|uniref:Uncharacterized protein n=1 Tax=Smallanthus sonchifolius TaxID=185202 RepID=A0ACB9J7J2_9ASTR|nr:hypothetical protein L1987_15350 [Smallanthus sonchifolius]